MAVTSVVGGAYYYTKWREADGAWPMLFAGALFAMIAYFRRTALSRKQEAFKEAVARYEEMLRQPFP